MSRRKCRIINVNSNRKKTLTTPCLYHPIPITQNDRSATVTRKKAGRSARTEPNPPPIPSKGTYQSTTTLSLTLPPHLLLSPTRRLSGSRKHRHRSQRVTWQTSNGSLRTAILPSLSRGLIHECTLPERVRRTRRVGEKGRRGWSLG